MPSSPDVIDVADIRFEMARDSLSRPEFGSIQIATINKSKCHSPSSAQKARDAYVFGEKERFCYPKKSHDLEE